MTRRRTSLVIVLGILLLIAGVVCVVVALTGNMPGVDQHVEQTTAWVKAEVILKNVRIPIEYQRFVPPLVLPAPANGTVTGPSTTPVTTVLSSLYCQTQGGSKEQWIAHFSDPSAARRESLATLTDDEWKENCRYTRQITISVLGTIRHGRYTVVVVKFKTDRTDGFVGVPTVERDGKYYRDAEADKCMDPVRKWLSENEYPMVTGATRE